MTCIGVKPAWTISSISQCSKKPLKAAWRTGVGPKAYADAGIRQLLQIAHSDLERLSTDTGRGVRGLCRTECALDGGDHFRLDTLFEKGVIQPCRFLCVNKQRPLTSQSRYIDSLLSKLDSGYGNLDSMQAESPQSVPGVGRQKPLKQAFWGNRSLTEGGPAESCLIWTA